MQYYTYTQSSLGLLFWIVFWLIIITLIIGLIRGFGARSGGGSTTYINTVPPEPIIPPTPVNPWPIKERTPLDLLNERYARGELTKMEYEQKRADILR